MRTLSGLDPHEDKMTNNKEKIDNLIIPHTGNRLIMNDRLKDKTPFAGTKSELEYLGRMSAVKIEIEKEWLDPVARLQCA